jgi:hypothetical protein
MHDLLLQTGRISTTPLIIEEGFPISGFTERMGETPIVVHPDAALTSTISTPRALPLTQLHLATRGGCWRAWSANLNRESSRCGRPSSQYLHQLYRDATSTGRGATPAGPRRSAAWPCAVHRWRERMPTGATPLEAFVDLRDRRAADDDEASVSVAGSTDEEVTQFAQDPGDRAARRADGVRLLRPGGFPDPRRVGRTARLRALPEHNKEEIDRLATLLRAWSADGQYGRLFDGVTNVSLHGRSPTSSWGSSRSRRSN